MFCEVMVGLRSSVTAQLQVCGDRVGQGRRKAKGQGRKERAGSTWMQPACGRGTYLLDAIEEAVERWLERWRA